jgi:Icc-related predicted phosphoesterase
MKLLVFSDIHNDAAALERIIGTEADCYVAAGDLVNFGRGLDKMGELLARRAGRMHVLPGNHESELDISALCARYGLSNLHGKSIELNGYHVAGLGYSTITPFDTPGEYTEEEIAARLEPFALLDPLILICHCPPHQTPLDEAGPGRHFGSRSVREFVERKQPAFLFCGHIHEAAGRTSHLGRTMAVNVGKRGYLLDLDKLTS